MTRRAQQSAPAGRPVTDAPSFPANEKTYTLKFVLAGSSGVGKTQLALRIIRGEFRESSLPTVGIEFGTRSLRYANQSSVRAQLWDAAGKVRFKSVTEAFYRGAAGAMLVYDISRRSTFDDLPQWLEHIRQHCHESIAVLLVGNKSDMSSKQREVSMVEGMRFARKHGLDFMETSALEDTNVEEACRQLVMSVARYLPQEKALWPASETSCRLPKGWVRVVDDDNDGDIRRVRNPDNNSGKQPRDVGVMTVGKSIRVAGNSVGYVGKSVEDGDGNETDDTDDAVTDHATNPSFDDDTSANSGASSNQLHNHHFRNLSSVDVSNFNSSVNYDEPDVFHSNGGYRGSSNRPAVWYENIWTGQRVERRPRYPAGPSDTCIVSHVPRPPDPLSFTSNTQKGGAEEEAGGNQLKMRGSTSSWSFSSLKRKSYAAATDCLTKCVNTTE